MIFLSETIASMILIHAKLIVILNTSGLLSVELISVEFKLRKKSKSIVYAHLIKILMPSAMIYLCNIYMFMWKFNVIRSKIV